MKRSYIEESFDEMAREASADRADALVRKMQERLSVLRRENADASKERMRHLESQILPSIAAYETLQDVMPKEEAFLAIHTCVESNAWKKRKGFERLMRIPGMYRLMPWVFAKGTRTSFNEAAGFEADEIQVDNGVWRIDMTKCPYYDICGAYGCPELCGCFCDSDDICYADLHPKLIWHRTKTLGRGGDCCDFSLRIEGR